MVPLANSTSSGSGRTQIIIVVVIMIGIVAFVGGILAGAATWTPQQQPEVATTVGGVVTPERDASDGVENFPDQVVAVTTAQALVALSLIHI